MKFYTHTLASTSCDIEQITDFINNFSVIFCEKFLEKFTSEKNANQEITFIFVLNPRTKQVNPTPDSF